MRKQSIYILPLMLLILLAATGCGKSDGQGHINKIEGMAFDSIVVDTVAPITDRNEGSKVHVRMSILYVKGTETINKEIKNSGIFFPEYIATDSMSIGDVAKAFASQYIKDYQRDYHEILAVEQANAGLEVSYVVRTKVEAATETSFCYSAYIEQFTGSGETSHVTICRNLNRKSGKAITLDDLFVTGYLFPLSEMIANRLAENEKLQSAKELAANGIFVGIDPYPANDFIIDEDGITFVYNEDEIASHEKGQVRVKLSFDDLSHIMKKKK